jgi:hypothetical protein
MVDVSTPENRPSSSRVGGPQHARSPGPALGLSPSASLSLSSSSSSSSSHPKHPSQQRAGSRDNLDGSVDSGSSSNANRDRIDSHELDFRRRGSGEKQSQAQAGDRSGVQARRTASPKEPWDIMNILDPFDTLKAAPDAAHKGHVASLEFTVRLTSAVSTCLAIPRSFIAGVALLVVFGRLFVTVAIAFHSAMDSLACNVLLWKGPVFRSYGISLLIAHALVDMGLNFMYVVAANLLVTAFLMEPDGTVCHDWVGIHAALECVVMLCYIIMATRLVAAVAAILVVADKYLAKCGACANASKRLSHTITESCHDGVGLNRKVKIVRMAWVAATVIAVSWCLGALIGCVRYTVLTSPPEHITTSVDICDPLVPSDCILPFPSNFHLAPDDSTATGYRVNIAGEQLPITKSGEYVDPSVVNALDGFSTLSPVLFALDGFVVPGANGSALPSSETISLSTTSSSMTLLIDVVEQKLVSHFTELDQGILTLQPASPLHHNKHYMVAMVNAISDDTGDLLPPSAGLVSLLAAKNRNDAPLSRNAIFRTKLFPALYGAAPWIELPAEESHAFPANVQLVFDFNTVSEDSQLSQIRATRDLTKAILDGPDWSWDKEERVTTIKIVEHDCAEAEAYIARTVHQQIEIPWFLKSYGSGHRGAGLDEDKLKAEKTDLMGKLKFVVQIPCSMKAAALDDGAADPGADDWSDFLDVTKHEISAVVEFGHGLFYSREELVEAEFLHKMAHDNGWLLIAADWRGMSMFDIPIIMKTLIADPSLFRSTLDNLIQGYVSKMCMLHYVRNRMLEEEWLRFGDGSDMRVPMAEEGVSVNFYGISQGGILGAGYNAMMGITGLLERSALGSPGTPFSFIMGKSTDMDVFNNIMLLNFYSKRDVKIMVSVVQMIWDTVEASGWLAHQISETPPPVLIQAGLGDTEVPIASSEILARSYGASILTGNPRDVFGLTRVQGWEMGGAMGPSSAITEVVYERENAEAREREDDGESVMPNNVHWCVRKDPSLQLQIVEFFKDGRIVDPCISDNCIRTEAYCDPSAGSRKGKR